MEEDENFKLTAAKLKEMGQKKMTREERKRRQRALSNLDIPNFETFWKVKRAENVEGVGEFIWTCLSKIIVHHIYQQLLYMFFVEIVQIKLNLWEAFQNLYELLKVPTFLIVHVHVIHVYIEQWIICFSNLQKKQNSDGTDIHSFVDKNNYAENFGCVFDFEMKLTWFNSLWIIQNQPNCFISTKKYR